ncbi:EVE domain-containing protein [Marinomonas atlantica]|uniref:EVE domain-containing protein n=1 Tax=Marinomonas atlantica TaxID=1806668 RepID=UPI0008333845|nr:EVE domain-containing protein [Marinomonas atlantica]
MSARFWVAVASADHVAIGVAQGFMQVCHGKAGPLKRLNAGDWVAYYSPTQTLGGKDKLQAFTAIGQIKLGEPYQVEITPEFKPYRRDVAWSQVGRLPIRPLLPNLSFSKSTPNWGYQLRFGLFEVTRDDLKHIYQGLAVTSSLL